MTRLTFPIFALVALLTALFTGCATITDVAGKDVAFVNDMMAARGDGAHADYYWKLKLISIDGRSPSRAFRDDKAILPNAVIPAGRHDVIVEVTRLSLTNSKDQRTERLTFPVTVQKGKNYLLTVQRGFPAIIEDTR